MPTKRFFCRVPNSTFIFSDGTVAVFNHGFVDISEKSAPGRFLVPPSAATAFNNGRPKHEVYQEEIEAIIGRNTNIFIQDAPPQDNPPVPQNARGESEVLAAEAAAARLRTTTSQETGPINVTGPSDVNANTMDPDLQRAMFEAHVGIPEVTGPGAAKKSIADIQAEAAARTAAQNLGTGG